MDTLRIILLGSLIMATPSLIAAAIYFLVDHIWQVREDRRSLRELRAWRHEQRERDRAERAALWNVNAMEWGA